MYQHIPPRRLRDIKQQEHLIMGLELTSDVRVAAYDLTMARPLN